MNEPKQRHPDWMYELYSNTLEKYRNQINNDFTKKPVAEKSYVPLNFSWKNEPYLHMLEEKGLI